MDPHLPRSHFLIYLLSSLQMLCQDPTKTGLKAMGSPWNMVELRDNGAHGFLSAWSSDSSPLVEAMLSLLMVSMRITGHQQCREGQPQTRHWPCCLSFTPASCLGLLSHSDGNMVEVKEGAVVQRPSHELKNTLYSNKESCKHFKHLFCW